MPAPARGVPHPEFGFSVGRASSSTFFGERHVIDRAWRSEISSLKFEIPDCPGDRTGCPAGGALQADGPELSHLF